MIGLLCLFLALLAAPFKSKSRLEAENAALRHQLIVLRRKVPGRVRLTGNDRWFFIKLYRWFPSILNVLMIIRPETLSARSDATFSRADFIFDRERNIYICPGGVELASTGNVDQGRIVYYRANKNDCSSCSLKPKCTTAK